jgi:hypothetical protein
MKPQVEKASIRNSQLELRVLERPQDQLASKDIAYLHRLKLEAQARCQSRRYLPFDECCKWVQANGMWESQDDWEEWVAMGEGLSPYIPTRPDEYYSRLGVWRGWDFFLLGCEDSDDDPRWEPKDTGPIITR